MGPGACLRFAGGAGGPAGAPCGEARNSSVDSLSPVQSPRGGGRRSGPDATAVVLERGEEGRVPQWAERRPPVRQRWGRTWFSDRRCLPVPPLASRHRRPQPRPHEAAFQPRPGDPRRKVMATSSGRGSRWRAWDMLPSRELLLTLLLGSGPAPGCPPWLLLKRTVDRDSFLKWWQLTSCASLGGRRVSGLAGSARVWMGSGLGLWTEGSRWPSSMGVGLVQSVEGPKRTRGRGGQFVFSAGIGLSYLRAALRLPPHRGSSGLRLADGRSRLPRPLSACKTLPCSNPAEGLPGAVCLENPDRNTSVNFLFKNVNDFTVFI